MLTIKEPKELNNQSDKLFWNRNRILKVGFKSELLKNTLYNNFSESLIDSLKTENRVTLRRIEPFSIKFLQYGHFPERKTDYRKSDKPFYCQCINRLITSDFAYKSCIYTGKIGTIYHKTFFQIFLHKIYHYFYYFIQSQ